MALGAQTSGGLSSGVVKRQGREADYFPSHPEVRKDVAQPQPL
jgi:hypothetical protein